MKILNTLELAPFNIPLIRRLQTLAVLAYVFLFTQGLSLCGVFLVIYLLFTDYYWLSLVYAVWYYMDANRQEQGGRGSHWVRSWSIWKYYCDYFPINLIKTTELDPNKNYLFCVSPHGIMSFGIFGNFATEGTKFSELFPGLTMHLLTLKEQFQAPIMREFFMTSGACSASAKSMKYILNNEGRCEQRGQVTALLAGGVAESLESLPGKYRLVIRKRKGFVRIALQTGASIVPVFSFGENDLFSAIPVEDGSMTRAIQTWLRKTVSFGLPIFWGRGVFNYSFGFLPYRKPIYTVVGKPLEVPVKIVEPRQEQIDEMHERYLTALTELFDAHKSKYLVDSRTVLELI